MLFQTARHILRLTPLVPACLQQYCDLKKLKLALTNVSHEDATKIKGVKAAYLCCCCFYSYSMCSDYFLTLHLNEMCCIYFLIYACDYPKFRAPFCFIAEKRSVIAEFVLWESRLSILRLSTHELLSYLRESSQNIFHSLPFSHVAHGRKWSASDSFALLEMWKCSFWVRGANFSRHSPASHRLFTWEHTEK